MMLTSCLHGNCKDAITGRAEAACKMKRHGSPAGAAADAADAVTADATDAVTVADNACRGCITLWMLIQKLQLLLFLPQFQVLQFLGTCIDRHKCIIKGQTPPSEVSPAPQTPLALLAPR